MSTPSTNTLDHIVHLTPPDTVEQASQQFRDLGFHVIPGGTHAGGLTANALVILSDGVYLELISFTHPASHYPADSPARKSRDASPWAHKLPGWIDFSFLGSSTVSVARLINARAQREGAPVRYAPEVRGGRTRPDGRVLEWVVCAPEDGALRGVVPFFCGDVTPREWRVLDPPSNAVHPSGALGIAHVRLLARLESLVRVSAQLTAVIGEPPRESSTSGDGDGDGREYVWTLRVPLTVTTTGAESSRLVLSAPRNDDEENHLETRGPGIFEVAFSVGRDGVEKESMTPYGKIIWLRT